MPRDKVKKAEYDRQRREEQRERLSAQKREYYIANRERLIAAVRDRVDPEAKRAYDREYNRRSEVRAARAAQRRAWAAANPEKAAAHTRRKNHRRRGAEPDATAREWMAILDRDPCAYCGDPMEHIEHVVPLAAGGDSAWDNLTAACQGCNYAKRDKPLLVFLGSGY